MKKIIAIIAFCILAIVPSSAKKMKFVDLGLSVKWSARNQGNRIVEFRQGFPLNPDSAIMLLCSKDLSDPAREAFRYVGLQIRAVR